MPIVMIWGGISVNGMARQFFLPPEMTSNGQKYHDLLNDKLKLYTIVHKCTIFMEDGVSGNNPDLNFKENLWIVLKNKVSKKQPSSAKELKKAIKEIWVP